jgi:hypothetical protein
MIEHAGMRALEWPKKQSEARRWWREDWKRNSFTYT